MKNLKEKVVWITGASSGIGEALALELSREGAFPVLSARNVQKLESVRQQCLKHTSQCWIMPADLSQTDKMEDLVDKVLKQAGRIDILINNAGRSQRSLAFETPLDIDRSIMEINYFSPVALTKLVLLHMLQKEEGHIVVISSISGKFGFPLRTAYTASKHAVQGFFEALRAELHGKNIPVTIISPGRIKTIISLNMDDGQASGMAAGACAAKIVKAIKNNRKELLIGKKEILMVYIRRFLPFIYHKIVHTINN
jgi:dehydrogenase/reductase SDR family protein 7B